MKRKQDLQRVERLLMKALAALPPPPKVLAVRVEEFIDTGGEDALEVRVVIGERTTLEQRIPPGSEPIRSAIRRALRQSGDERPALVQFRKPSELERERRAS